MDETRLGKVFKLAGIGARSYNHDWYSQESHGDQDRIQGPEERRPLFTEGVPRLYEGQHMNAPVPAAILSTQLKIKKKGEKGASRSFLLFGTAQKGNKRTRRVNL